MSRVSASGFTPYFFIMIGSESSVRGINAAYRQINKQTSISNNRRKGKKSVDFKPYTFL